MTSHMMDSHEQYVHRYRIFAQWLSHSCSGWANRTNSAKCVTIAMVNNDCNQFWEENGTIKTVIYSNSVSLLPENVFKMTATNYGWTSNIMISIVLVPLIFGSIIILFFLAVCTYFFILLNKKWKKSKWR
jgi:hypothetical protein